jgi:hypothetical protein
MSQAAAITAVEAMWAANPWGRAEPVVWHQNTRDQMPSAATNQHWLHIAVEFYDENVVAFGGGRRDNERRLRGSIVLRGFAQRGRGEDTLLAMLDAAVDVFRSRREGNLSILGEMVMPEPGASADGIWWVRTAIAPFEYRFRG